MNIEYYIQHRPEKRVRFAETCCSVMEKNAKDGKVQASSDKTGVRISLPLGYTPIDTFYFCPWCGEQIIIDISREYNNV